MPAPHVLFHVRHVHGAALALGCPGDLAEQFSHHFISWDTTIDRHAMVAVGGDDPVLRLPGGDQPGADGFLPDIQVHETADLALLVQLRPAFFHAADEHHFIVHLQ